MKKAYKGHVIFTSESHKFDVFENSYVLVEDGKVTGIQQQAPEGMDVVDWGDRLIIPGLVDLHFHAPQFPNIGLGLDKELLPWLEDYTFPTEAKFKDPAYAKDVYSAVVKMLWRNGTTRAVLFSSLHGETTDILMDLCHQAGIGAYVGKVNMDRNTPDFLVEETGQSIADTKAWIDRTGDKYPMVKPIITPRFVPTCSSELMNELGKMAAEMDLPIQSHISENLGEVEWVKDLHPEFDTYADVYEGHGLWGDRTIMAHCVHNTNEEIKMMAKAGVMAAHCPNANNNLSSGVMPVRAFMEAGCKVGLGTDVGAGHKVSMAQVMSQAVQMSKLKWLESGKQLAPLTTAEAFYLGTKGGGSFFGKVGSFEPGFAFDALVIDDAGLSAGGQRSIEERLQRFIYCGDDRNIITRYVEGKELNEPNF